MTVRIGSRKLLVSVRSVAEACDAMQGGAEIIDVKEPSHGSLGRADEGVIAEIAQAVISQRSDVAVSAALGEVSDNGSPDGFHLSDDVRYAKLGLSHLRDDPRWSHRWVAVREKYQCSRTSKIHWIAVIYADEAAAEAPPADEIITAAIETGCVGVLIDTWSKVGGSLLDQVTPDRLATWAERLHQAGLFFAVAGRLSIEDFPQLRDVAADVFAVRSAVCEGQDRQAAINSLRVRGVRQAMDKLSQSNSSTEVVGAPLSED